MTKEEIKNTIDEARKFATEAIIKWIYECDLYSNKAALLYLSEMAGGRDNYLKHWEPLEATERKNVYDELREDLLNELRAFRAIKKSDRVAFSRILRSF